MNKSKFWDAFGNYLFVVPALILFCTFSIYPFYKVFQLSFMDWDGISVLSWSKDFIWFKQYWDLFVNNAVWWKSMANAGYITFLALTVQNALALGLALLVDRNIRGGSVYRVIFFLPPVLSGIVVGLIWNWIYDGNYGLLNHFLEVVGRPDLATDWLAKPGTALTSVAVIHMWKGFGWGFVILLAGLQNIPEELYEAAKVDGAGTWESFKAITVPLMVPVFILVSILTILGTMQIFDIIVATTGGGPGYHTEVPITRIYHALHASRKFGYASSMGVVFGIILLILSLGQIQLSKRLKQD